MSLYFVSDALASRIQNTESINSNLGMERNIPRGAELEDAALLGHLKLDIVEKLCSEISVVDQQSFYIISNFVTLTPQIKQQLIKYKNYIIFEHDHKYIQTRNPFSFSTDGKVPADKLINIDFYRAAKKVVCITEWHQAQVKLNTGADVANIHGGIWTASELDMFETIAESRTPSSKYAIFWSTYKNPQESLQYASSNKLEYRLLRSISNRQQFLEILSKHKGLIFFPSIPETGSRLIMESKMMGLEVITNNFSGAANEYWFNLSGKELVDLFRKLTIDNVNLFKGLLNV